MGASIVCALAFVKSFFRLFGRVPETTDATDFADHEAGCELHFARA
jgi:hypothetical protein